MGYLALLAGVAFIIIGVWDLKDKVTEFKSVKYLPLRLNLINNMLREFAMVFLVIAIFKFSSFDFGWVDSPPTMWDFLYPMIAYGIFHVIDLILYMVGKIDHWNFERNFANKEGE